MVWRNHTGQWRSETSLLRNTGDTEQQRQTDDEQLPAAG
jgi:hypothetical protein